MYVLNSKQEQLLKDLYYNKKLYFGRDKLYDYVKNNHPDLKISRRMLMFWLKNQEVYQINFGGLATKTTKSFDIKKPGYIQVDLIDMSSNPERGFYWILTAIDIFTKKTFASPLKTKKQTSVVKVMERMLDYFDNVSIIQTDNGNEFNLPAFYEAAGVKHITSKAYTPQSQGYVERFNGTLKSLIEKNRQITGKNTWINDLPVLVRNYNDIKKDNSQAEKVNLVDNKIKFLERVLKTGDKVRVKLKKSALNKKYAGNFTKETYTIYKIFNPSKPFELKSYKLKDSDGDLIEGVYNASELLLAEVDPNIKIK